MKTQNMFHCNVTRGHSMDYCMMAGDAVLYNNDKTYFFGDIILYKSSRTGEVIGHRFFFRIFNLYLVAGDNCCNYELICSKQLLGRGMILIRGSKQKYNISEKTDTRTKYCVFLMCYIVLAFLRFKLGLFKTIFSKMVIQRNKMQIKYMEQCRL